MCARSTFHSPYPLSSQLLAIPFHLINEVEILFLVYKFRKCNYCHALYHLQ